MACSMRTFRIYSVRDSPSSSLNLRDRWELLYPTLEEMRSAVVTRVYIAHTLTDGSRERGGLPVGMDSVDEIIDHTIVDSVELIDMCGVGNFLPVAADEICRGSRWESPIRGGA